MRLKEFGNAHIILLVITAVLTALGVVGWRVYSTKTNNGTSQSLRDQNKASSYSEHKRIVAIGDVACDPTSKLNDGDNPLYCQDAKVAIQASKLNPDAILALGDLQYDDGALEKFQKGYGTIWGNFKAITYPTPGNHEYSTANASGYYTYFMDAAADVSKGYYSFNLGKWHLISLNSNCGSIVDCSQESSQIKWLTADLETNKSNCTLAFWHHPHFTSGKYFNDLDSKNRSSLMWEKLVTKKADVILNGHDHLYERFAPQTTEGKTSKYGVRQFTVGTGGKELYDLNGQAPNSDKTVVGQYGLLIMDLYEDAYKWEFVNVYGQILDSGYQRCN